MNVHNSLRNSNLDNFLAHILRSVGFLYSGGNGSRVETLQKRLKTSPTLQNDIIHVKKRASSVKNDNLRPDALDCEAKVISANKSYESSIVCRGDDAVTFMVGRRSAFLGNLVR